MDSTLLRNAAAAALAAMDGVVARPEFGNQSYWIGNSRFAAVTDRGVVAHLPPAELIEAMKRGIARPFVSIGAMGRNGWVEISGSVDQAALEWLLAAAATAARHGHRRTSPRRPGGARRTSRTPAKR